MHFTMKITLLACCAVAALVAFGPRAVFAHHGSAAYDMSKSLTLDGTVTSLDWNNPHCLLHFDAKDEKGEVQHWTIELYNPLWMTRAGWTRTILKAGDPINITFHGTKSGAPNGYIRDGDGKLTSNGKELAFHQAGDERQSER
jgi:Family of unknown function (DUF6152)